MLRHWLLNFLLLSIAISRNFGGVKHSEEFRELLNLVDSRWFRSGMS
jgi:hypothetical protein